MIGLRWASRLYLVFLVVSAFLRLPGHSGLNVGLLGLILGLGIWRMLRAHPMAALPDPILATLPFFWCLNILLMHHSPGSNIADFHDIRGIHFALFAWGMLLLAPSGFGSRHSANRPILGVLLSALFYFGFLTILKLLFSPFPTPVFQRALLAGLFFYTVFPLAYPAFFPYPNVSSA